MTTLRKAHLENLFGTACIEIVLWFLEAGALDVDDLFRRELLND